MAEPEETQKPLEEEPVSDTPEASDPETDKAVDDIVRAEGDDELKAQDEAAVKAVEMKRGLWQRFKSFQSNWWSNPRKRWGTIAVIVVLVAGLLGVPVTRYDVIGLLVHEKVTVEAVDSKTGKPVSGAEVQVGGAKAETNGEGMAVLYSHAGSKHLQASKKYYTGSTETVLVTLSASHNIFKAKLVALGREVSVKVVNKITNKPVENAEISAGGTTAKTNKSGMADVVLPSSASTQAASISLSGYNTTPVSIDAGGSLSKDTFAVTPSGKLYFLSNLSGTIDVVKTNLDGTDRQTVLAGTGDEDPNDTSLLASRDWKYLALLSKRSGNNASLYLIDTTNNDKLTTIDEGNATFTPIGWAGDRFIYQVDRSATVSDWQPDQEALKSFDPTTGHTLLLDQTQGSGTSTSDYVKQYYLSSYIIGNQVVYSKNWQSSYYDVSQMDGNKAAELDAINADGSSHQVLKTFSLASGSGAQDIFIDTVLYGPDVLYIDFANGSAGSQYYEYSNSTVTADNSLTDASFWNGSSYPTYLLSPSGNNTFWAEPRDGQNTLLIGDEAGSNQKQIASLSPYSPYGWYTDNYLLVSQNGSELYIMPTAGGTPLKITDYYKSQASYNGYGGGYGGL